MKIVGFCFPGQLIELEARFFHFTIASKTKFWKGTLEASDSASHWRLILGKAN